MNLDKITEIIIPEDKDTICRFCLNLHEHNNMISLDSEIIKYLKVGNTSLLKLFSRLFIAVDMAEYLPRKICGTCQNTFKEFLEFIDKIEGNEEFLKTVYSDEQNFIFNNDSDTKETEIHKEPITLEQVNMEHAYGKKDGVKLEFENDESREMDFESFLSTNNTTEENCELNKENSLSEYLIIKQKKEFDEINPKPSIMSQKIKNVDTEFGKYKVYNSSPNVVKIKVLNGKHFKQPIKKIIRLNPYREPSKLRKVIKNVDEPEILIVKQCFFCEKKFSSDGLRILHYVEHVVQATENTINHRPFCSFCGFLPLNKEQLDEHVQEKHEGDDELHCHGCQIKFSNLGEVTAHEEKNHVENYEVIEEQEEEESKKCKCPICDEKYEGIEELINHSLTHISRRYTCMTCKKIFVCEAALNEHHKEHPQYRYKCHICKRLSSTKGALEAHVATHSTTRDYACDVCDKRYKTKPHLLYHRSTHFKTNLICSYCAYATPSTKDFSMHMRIHSDERPFPCTFEDCGKSFKTNSALSSHVKQHLNIKNFECDLCDYKTSRSVGLTIHRRRHTGEKPFVCDVCFKCFNRKWSLTLHMRKLHPFESGEEERLLVRESD